MQHAARNVAISARITLSLFALLLACVFTAPTLYAGGIEELQAFIKQTRSARATFTQTVVDAQGVNIQDSSGVVEFSRPGRFRWHYLEPFEQLVIGDGTNLWVYDKDLAQVTTRKLGRALGSSPAALLAGSDDVERYFSLESMGRQGGYEWLEVIPKDEDSLFEKVRMGFSSSTLQVMELYDHFGQKTVILFSDFKRNPKFAPDAFSFTPPPGVDVVTD
ncbi:MAG: outer membrane lipoprotein chaperone LolA [Betaproteobacteria bacterium]|nr:MAG: outer membrane lipoprotein chaperone LolA [Betaproteobacteria bacterium]